MALLKKILTILILIGVVFFVTKKCTPPEIIDNSTTVYDTIRDSIPYAVPEYVPQLIYKDTGSTQWRDRLIDTAAILAEFFAKNFYRDTIVNDSTGLFVLEDTLHQNKIWSRKITGEAYSRTFYETTTITDPYIPKNKYFFGIGAGGSLNKFDFSGDLMFQNKKDNVISLSYEVLSQEVWLKSFWKIKF